MTDWYSERLSDDSDDGLALQFDCETILCERRTAYQDLSIVQSPTLGRVLLLDGIVQLAERDEFVYHESIVHVPVLSHGAVRSVLIIGGGDGGTLRELLKHPVEHVTMVEIDKAVVESCREYLPSVSDGAFDDPRLELKFDDGVAFLRDSAAEYDLILVDSTDPYPTGPGAVLFSKAFYADCRRVLGDTGIIVTQKGTPFLYPDSVRAAQAMLAACFSDVTLYLVAVPTFAGGYTAFGWGSMERAFRCHSSAELRRRLEAAGVQTRFYTPEFHVAAFSLPQTYEALLAGTSQPATVPAAPNA